MAAPLDPNERMEVTAERLGIGHYKRHVLLCTGPTCCTPEVGAASWDALKNELKAKGLSLSTGDSACYRTKVGCLRICGHGPIAVVYPEGTWYHGITADKVPQLVDSHLVRGEPVREWIFAENRLPATD